VEDILNTIKSTSWIWFLC